MSKRASPTLIGAFVLGALILGVVVILLLSGGQWFRERKLQIMYFEGAAQGLQVGAPVVFLGVRIGTVKQIQLGLAEEAGTFLVPVTVEIMPSTVLTRTGEDVDLRDPSVMKDLVARGLRAQLRMQSLLTGQLYVDLDFYPDKPARYFAIDATLNEIPTIPTTVDELFLKLEGFPMERFLDDLAVIGQSLRKILATDETAELPLRLRQTLASLESLAKTLETGSTPLLRDLRTSLTEMNRALGAVTEAADQVKAMADPTSPLYASLSRAGEELAGAAGAIRDVTAAETPTRVHLEAALLEITRAARALRLLAETLEQQPEALLRGKRPPEASHGQ